MGQQDWRKKQWLEATEALAIWDVVVTVTVTVMAWESNFRRSNTALTLPLSSSLAVSVDKNGTAAIIAAIRQYRRRCYSSSFRRKKMVLIQIQIQILI